MRHLDYNSDIDFVDQDIRYMDLLYYDDTRLFENWFIWIKENLYNILKTYEISDKKIIQAGTWNGLVYNEFKNIFGSERCVGFDIETYVADDSIIYGDFRKIQHNFNMECSLFYNGLGSWKKNKTSKQAGLDYALRNLVPGGLYLDVTHQDNSILLDIPELKYCNTYDNKLIILRKTND
jgi:hypothetical protein